MSAAESPNGAASRFGSQASVKDLLSSAGRSGPAAIERELGTMASEGTAAESLLLALESAAQFPR